MVEFDEIIRSKRKSIAIVIDPDGRVIVRAPKRATKRQIEYVLRENKHWIEEKRSEILSRYPKVLPKKFVDGEEFYYLGMLIPLIIVERKRPALILTDKFELSRHSQSAGEHAFTEWYREAMRKSATVRAGELAAQHGFTFHGIRITSARTRWGSCNSRGGLNFPWRLVMAPLEVIDYVVLHELLHTEIQNHSREFWDRLEMLMPDYRIRRKWLKDNGYKLTLT